jgi:hypothetical protein
VKTMGELLFLRWKWETNLLFARGAEEGMEVVCICVLRCFAGSNYGCWEAGISIQMCKQR